MSSPPPSLVSSKNISTKIRLQSKKIDYHNKLKASSPISLKLTKSSDDLLNRCLSPVLMRKKLLTELIIDLSSTSNQLEKTKIAFKALKMCSEEEGNYSKEMKKIVEVLQNALFINKDQVESEVIEVIYEKYVEAIVGNSYFTYVHVVDGLRSVLEKYKNENSALKVDLNKLIVGKKEEVFEKRMEIAKLKAKIEMNLTEPLKIKEAEYKALEEKYNVSLKSLEELRNIITEKDEVIKKFKTQSSVHSKIIYEFQCLDEENKIRIKDLTEDLAQANQNLKVLQDDNYRKKHNLEVAVFRLKCLVEKEKELESQVKTLEFQNDDLTIKAGVGFENLTPRPSFSGIENILQEVPQSSEQKVKKLIECALALNSPQKHNTVYKKKTIRMTTKHYSRYAIESNSEQNDN